MKCICGHKREDHYWFDMGGDQVSECGHEECPCMGFKDEENYGVDLEGDDDPEEDFYPDQEDDEF